TSSVGADQASQPLRLATDRTRRWQLTTCIPRECNRPTVGTLAPRRQQDLGRRCRELFRRYELYRGARMEEPDARRGIMIRRPGTQRRPATAHEHLPHVAERAHRGADVQSI